VSGGTWANKEIGGGNGCGGAGHLIATKYGG